MHIVGREVITDYAQGNPKAKSPLFSWVSAMEGCEARHFPDLKKTFGSADYKKPVTIFDIGGNNYRMITKIMYVAKTVSVLEVITHDEYNENKWKKRYGVSD